ncbi:TonB-dependent receptor [Pedobacter alpinus]|uniref:Carboxypeptidase regulatory-like domain-containing protein n=1 Tax=Pedobacter alpinus TaxID=1590643 RepID=A0ABW5TX04_9SPHI
MKRKLQTKLLTLIAMMTIMVSAAIGQITTSSMSGIVKDSKGESLPGATIKAIHTPTGSVYATQSNAEGRFNLLNMRAGGPYSVNVTFLGLNPKKVSGLNLKLGENFVYNVNLGDATTELGEVVVTGNGLLSSSRTGAVTNIGTREINTLPTISRSINDITRVTPQAQGSSIGGGNYRQNNITVDGANFNNSFGIGDNLPGGQATPIPLDALGEISVNVAPVDVRQSGFIGGAVNLTTRSGTNEFSGSAYTYFRNQDNVGTQVKNYDRLTPNPNDVKIYGARIGGPIIKNKLFFFGSVESDKQARPGQNAFAQTPNQPWPGTPNARRPTAARLTEISNYLRDTYGYETGAFEGYGFASERLNIVAKIDWNINKNNRFNIRYSQLESKNPSFLSGSFSPLNNSAQNPVYGPAGGSRTGNTALHFQNSNYFTNNNYYSLVTELNSTIGGKFNNTFRASYTNQNEPRTSESSEFPLVDILEDGQPFTTFGYEPFTFGNLRDVESINVIDYVQATFGKHNLLAGFEFETSTTKNGFQRFGTGYYVFNSWDDFVNGGNARSFAQTYSLTPGYAQAFPTFKDSQLGIYFQDDFNVNDKLNLSFGLRGDIYSYKQDLLSHPLISPLTFANGEKLDTGVLPTTAFLISPRIGFNYDVKGDRSLQLRGSAGVFSGGIPNVWIVSQAGDSGLLQFTDVRQPTPGQNTIPNTPFNPDPRAYLPAVQPTAGVTIPNTLNFLDPNLKAPQAFKGNLAIDKKLPWGIVATIEGIYNYDINQVLSRNANLNDAASAPLNYTYPANAPGGLGGTVYGGNRPIYPSSIPARYINKLQRVNGNNVVTAAGTSLLNTYVGYNKSGGYNYSLSFQLQKQFEKGFSASVAYVRQEGKNYFDGGGDQFAGTWTGNATVNGSNDPELGFNGFVPDRLFATVSYRKEFLKHLGTSFTMFYEGSSQGRVSYTYSADFNQDGANNDLIYVPLNRSDITFTPFTAGGINYTAAAQADIFFRYLEQDNYLNSRRGKFAERNGGLLPWVNSVDFNFTQDLFTNIGNKRNTLQFNWTVNNFGNFINKNWGVRKQQVRNQILVPTSTQTPGGTNQPTFRLQFDGPTPVTQLVRDNVSFNSTYSMQFGFRYIFN